MLMSGHSLWEEGLLQDISHRARYEAAHSSPVNQPIIAIALTAIHAMLIDVGWGPCSR